MNTYLYNMTFGALGALILFAFVAIVRRLNRWAPLTLLRNATRRLLGIEHFEELSLDELRTYRVDVDRWSRDVREQSRRNATEIASVRRDVATRMAADRTRNNRVRTEVEELGILLRSYTNALGPMWTTAAGHQMPMRLLSTGHLRNILEGGFARSMSVADFIESELDRRRIDSGFRADAAAGKPAPTRQDMVLAAIQRNRDATRENIGSRLALQADTQERVRQVLPIWAQNIVTKLRERDTTVMTPSNRRRVKNLAQWAQVLIADLLRRAKR